MAGNSVELVWEEDVREIALAAMALVRSVGASSLEPGP